MPLALKIGADPECFIRYKGTQQYVSAFGMIPGTKTKPYKVEKGAIQVDGMAAEFNIDPASSVEEFTGNIKTVVAQLREYIPKDMELAAVPSVTFAEGYYAAQPASSKILGCEPDFNAYTGKANDPPKANGTVRAAGGHVHIGWREGADVGDADHFADCIEVVNQLDFYLGVPSLNWDKDTVRRKMYGRAGAFRPKPYGCEYRSLSCAWLRSPALQEYVYNATVLATQNLFNGKVARVVYRQKAWPQVYIDAGTFMGAGLPANMMYNLDQSLYDSVRVLREAPDVAL